MTEQPRSVSGDESWTTLPYSFSSLPRLRDGGKASRELGKYPRSHTPESRNSSKTRLGLYAPCEINFRFAHKLGAAMDVRLRAYVF